MYLHYPYLFCCTFYFTLDFSEPCPVFYLSASYFELTASSGSAQPILTALPVNRDFNLLHNTALGFLAESDSLYTI